MVIISMFFQDGVTGSWYTASTLRALDCERRPKMAIMVYAVHSFTIESIQICSLRSFPKILPHSNLGRQETEVPELVGFMFFPDFVVLFLWIEWF